MPHGPVKQVEPPDWRDQRGGTKKLAHVKLRTAKEVRMEIPSNRQRPLLRIQEAREGTGAENRTVIR